jgi:hypothetical protein
MHQKRTLLLAGGAALAVLALLLATAPGPDNPDRPAPAPPAPDPPCPKDPPCPPRPRPKPWDRQTGMPVGIRGAERFGALVNGPRHADGTEIDCDLPGEMHRKNVASRRQGCCVFTSLHHSAVWQNVPALVEFPAWLHKKGLPGGGYPGNVKERITAICKDRGVSEPPYVQVEGDDLEVLRAACRSGRMPAVTYGWSPTGRYGGRRIPHMVSLVAATEKWFVILDNNYPGTSNYEWLTPAEFQKCYAALGGGWAVILLDEGPPPVPHNGGNQ